MQGEIITIGNELISGRTVNLNAWYIAGRLTDSGFSVARITTVGDNLQRASCILKEAVRNSRFVIVTGGLGVTKDDITSEIAADVLQRPLCLHEEMLRLIKAYVDKSGLEMSPSLEKMAWMPEGAKILDPGGTTCGFSLVEDQVLLYFLPGVPDQTRYLMDKAVLPELLARFRPMPVMRQRLLKLYGIGEAQIAAALQEVTQREGGPVLGFYPQFPENHITISLRGHDESAVLKELDRIENEIRNRLGPYIFASGRQRMEEVVGRMLSKRRMTLAVAESCTGGLIGNLLTNVPGSSNYFNGGMIVYSNKSKEDLLHVSPKTLQEFGAVSDPTAREMARGVRRELGSDIGLSVTGIAGPGGGTAEKPVGTIYLGLAVSDEIHSGRLQFKGSRKQIRINAAIKALDLIRRYFNGDPLFPGI